MTISTTKHILCSILIIGFILFSHAHAATNSQYIINQLRNEGRSDEEIKQEAEDLGLDIDYLFSSTSNSSSNSKSSNSDSETTYTTKSCKSYDIKYVNLLEGYTSDNLKSKEYFVNINYFKKYIDSKNSQKSGCPNNYIQLSQYIDNSNSTEKFIAPNGKIYFIMDENGLYTSYELSSNRTFNSIQELKNFIKARNPLSN